MTEIERHGAVTVIRPTMTLTCDYVGMLDGRISEGMTGGIPMVVVDMTASTLIDGAGLEWLLSLDEECSLRGGSVRVTGVSELCNDILRVTGVGESVAQYETLTEALASFS